MECVRPVLTVLLVNIDSMLGQQPHDRPSAVICRQPERIDIGLFVFDIDVNPMVSQQGSQARDITHDACQLEGRVLYAIFNLYHEVDVRLVVGIQVVELINICKPNGIEELFLELSKFLVGLLYGLFSLSILLDVEPSRLYHFNVWDVLGISLSGLVWIFALRIRGVQVSILVVGGRYIDEIIFAIRLLPFTKELRAFKIAHYKI